MKAARNLSCRCGSPRVVTSRPGNLKSARPGQETQFTSLATSFERSRSSFRHTTTRCVAGSVAITYSGSPVAMPSPRRWPTVKWMMPSWRPNTLPERSTMSPASAAPGRKRSITSV